MPVNNWTLPLCWVGRHRWKNFGGNLSKAMALAHLHPQAGNLDLCTRCGKVWDDMGGWVNDEPEFKAYRKRKLNEIGEYASMTGLRLKGDWR